MNLGCRGVQAVSLCQLCKLKLKCSELNRFHSLRPTLRCSFLICTTSDIFLNLNYLVYNLQQTVELQLIFTPCVDVSVSRKSVTLTVAFVTLEACVCGTISPLPAYADSACLLMCVCVCADPVFPLFPPTRTLSLHRARVSDPGRLSAGGTADPRG